MHLTYLSATRTVSPLSTARSSVSRRSVQMARPHSATDSRIGPDENRIVIECSPPHIKELNGDAERAGRSLTEHTRTIRIKAHLLASL